jgi:hypothetical protein
MQTSDQPALLDNWCRQNIRDARPENGPVYLKESFQTVRKNHRHLRKIDQLMAHTACLVCRISTVSGRSKKAKNVVLAVGAQQNLSNLDFL